MKSIVPSEAVLLVKLEHAPAQTEETSIEFISSIQFIQCVQSVVTPQKKRNRNELLNFCYRIENVRSAIRYISQ